MHISESVPRIIDANKYAFQCYQSFSDMEVSPEVHPFFDGFPPRWVALSADRSLRERERMERLTQATNTFLGGLPENFRRLGLAAESAQGGFERLAEIEIEPIDSPEIFIPRSTRDHFREASGRISQVSRMGDLSEVVESYERLRADSDRGRMVDGDDLDRLFFEIGNLTNGGNTDG